MCDRPCDKSKCRNNTCSNTAATSGNYSVKARPNLFDLAVMDGFLTGGGNAPSVQRMAYWAPENTYEGIGEALPEEHLYYDDLDDI